MPLDIGSSPQLDDAARGMSFRFDAPLDMRMDTSRGFTVADWLATAELGQITEVIRDYGEERFAHAIAKAIVAAREGQPVTTTRQLAEIVEKAVRTREPGQHPATRTFQALRIFINQELEELALALPQCMARLKARWAPGGHQLSFARRSHRQALHARCLASAATAFPVAAQGGRNARARNAAGWKGGATFFGRSLRQSAIAQRRDAGGRATGGLRWDA